MRNQGLLAPAGIARHGSKSPPKNWARIPGRSKAWSGVSGTDKQVSPTGAARLVSWAKNQGLFSKVGAWRHKI